MSRRTSLIGLGAGLAAAGVGAAVGLAAERLAVGRPVMRQFPSEDDEVPLGSIRDVPVPVTASDGITLHAEIDEPDAPDPTGLTVIFCHGYSLNLDSWHFQRLSMQGRVRCVYWDQRGHGRSEKGKRADSTITQLGKDLAAVIEATAPTGPLVLVGHSMGGMTIMAFAQEYPEIVAERVAGVAFISTSSGDLGDIDLGLDMFGYTLHRVAPRAIRLLAHRPGLVEKTRRIGSDLEEVIVKRWSYASDVDADLVDFTARMIAATRIDVVGDFLPQFAKHAGSEGLAVLAGLPALVLTGDMDLMIPPEHSQVIADALPGSELVVVRTAGHLVMLEHPEVVTPHLVALLHTVRRSLDGDPGELSARSVGHRRRRDGPMPGPTAARGLTSGRGAKAGKATPGAPGAESGAGSGTAAASGGTSQAARKAKSGKGRRGGTHPKGAAKSGRGLAPPRRRGSADGQG
ncbi:MAG: alpha/beta fold hydrolase [Actinomycetales bacterium]